MAEENNVFRNHGQEFNCSSIPFGDPGLSLPYSLENNAGITIEATLNLCFVNDPNSSERENFLTRFSNPLSPARPPIQPSRIKITFQCPNHVKMDDSTMQEKKWLNEPKKKRERRSLKPKIENKIENSNTSLDNSNASFDNTNTSLNEENNHDCDICGLEHKSGKAMMSHRQALHPGRKFLCRDCGKEFSLNANMKVHRRSLHQQVKIPCEQCGSQFTNRSNFLVHAKKFHPV